MTDHDLLPVSAVNDRQVGYFGLAAKRYAA
jgi:hypothetical protein